MIVLPENVNFYIGHQIAIGTEQSFTIQRLLNLLQDRRRCRARQQGTPRRRA
jgi:hypothetical protein